MVRANRGAAGVAGESLAMFEKDLKGNLYKIWNPIYFRLLLCELAEECAFQSETNTGGAIGWE